METPFDNEFFVGNKDWQNWAASIVKRNSPYESDMLGWGGPREYEAAKKLLKKFISYAKSNSGNINYGSTGIGTTAHLISFLFCQKVGIEATHIPYKGAEATRDLVAGRLQFMFATAPSVVPLIKGGQLNAIAVSSKKRISAMPDLPTLNELGVDIATGAWFGLFAPAGTNPAIIKKLNETVVSILDEPAIRQKLLGLGADPILMNVQEFTKFVRNDYALWMPIVKASGAKPE
jgi:tripartite-type tricarboxylate transporter receptor subunit TctC